jgi:phenylpropionate dioxygenase-like ring-hydroxylating dioxygenase large terminal subunit
MSSTLIRRELKPTVSPSAAGLPISWYFDSEIWELERRTLFDRGHGYVGHVAMVPKDGNYIALAGANDGWLLTRNGGEVCTISNICRHRQARMLDGRGSAKRIVCPVHNWAYDFRGRQVAAPHFDEHPCLDLETRELSEWNGLLFAGPRDPRRDLAPLTGAFALDADEYVLDRFDIEEYPINWKAIIEVFVEDYHIGAVHPGFRAFVDSGHVRDGGESMFGKRFFLEKVRARWPLGAAGSANFAEYQRLLLDIDGGREPEFGAVWLCHFPNQLIEVYPHAFVVSTYESLTPEHTRVCSEYYFRREIYEERKDFVDVANAVFAEVSAEDQEVSDRLHAGRSALYRRGDEHSGPYQQPMEQGLAHFHEFLRDACS